MGMDDLPDVWAIDNTKLCDISCDLAVSVSQQGQLEVSK